MRIESSEALDALTWNGDGLVPVVAQDARTGEVLMLAWANREALECTLAERTLWLWSRSRARLWRKGETSGHVLRLVALDADCDRDALVARVVPAGPACHTGERSCFSAPPLLVQLDDTIDARRRDPAAPGHTRRLLDDPNLRHKKLGEEIVELVSACVGRDRDRVIGEGADVLYHVLVACAANDVRLPDLLEELARRSKH